MSYCRFSSDNYKCDVYAYESADGFVVHVANNRYVGNIPVVPAWSESTHDEWLDAHMRQMAAVKNGPIERINGPYDGETFVYPTVEDMASGLRQIAAAGYHVPTYVFDEIEEETNGRD